jgi:hypothetical protein
LPASQIFTFRMIVCCSSVIWKSHKSLLTDQVSDDCL